MYYPLCLFFLQETDDLSTHIYYLFEVILVLFLALCGACLAEKRHLYEFLLMANKCVHVCVSQAEARLAAKRAARAEARDIRMRELERQQKEVYNTKKDLTGFSQ